MENSSNPSQWMWGTKQLDRQLDRHPIHTQLHCSWVTSRRCYRVFVGRKTRVQWDWMKNTPQGRAKAHSARTKTENWEFVLSLKSKNFSLYPRKKHGLVGIAGSSQDKGAISGFFTGCGETFLMAPFPIFNVRVLLAKMARTSGSAGDLADRHRKC